jgi:hypothetical protein
MHAVHSHLPWNGRRPLHTPIITTRCPWFDHLIACVLWWWHVYWKPNVIRHTYIVHFLTRNHTTGNLCVNLLSLCMCVKQFYVELGSNISELSVRVDKMSVVFRCYIYTRSSHLPQHGRCGKQLIIWIHVVIGPSLQCFLSSHHTDSLSKLLMSSPNALVWLWLKTVLLT